MNFGIIIILTIAGIWALGVFLGLIGGLSKTFTHAPVIDSSDIQTQAQKSIEETDAKQKQMMEDMKQKMEDSSRKY